jgi:hypothetical protein
MNLHEFMHSYDAQIILNANNLFKLQFLMHMDDVLGKLSVVESSYWIYNYNNI